MNLQPGLPAQVMQVAQVTLSNSSHLCILWCPHVIVETARPCLMLGILKFCALSVPLAEHPKPRDSNKWEEGENEMVNSATNETETAIKMAYGKRQIIIKLRTKTEAAIIAAKQVRKTLEIHRKMTGKMTGKMTLSTRWILTIWMLILIFAILSILSTNIYLSVYLTKIKNDKISIIYENSNNHQKNHEPVYNLEKKITDEFHSEEPVFPFGSINDGYWRPTLTNLWVYTVPRYPDNHNPLLPLNLQQHLDEMSPREYLTYVLKELTLEERESLMVDEKQRRRSFLVNWPYDDQRSGIRMAQAGFYSLDAYDRVQCVFCRGSLHNWDTGETPITEHSRSFNFCRFIKGLECGNREYISNMLSEDDVRSITQFQSVRNCERHHRTNGETVDSVLLGISTNRAAMIRYAPDATRLRTFARWPASCPITSQRMCDAGFYFTGFEDQVRCFYCSGGVKQWSEKDDPWEEHARWFPDCAYLIQQKGQSYVDEVHDKTPANKKCVRKTQAQKNTDTKRIEESTMQQEMTSVCLHLGHSQSTIRKTILRNNNKPFDNIVDMIDVIYAVESDGEDITDYGYADQSLGTDAIIQSHALDCPVEDRRRLIDQQDEITIPGRFDGTEFRPKYELGCRKCEQSTESFVPATHVGLPCGHLIYCDSCNIAETKKSSQAAYLVKCPFYNCSAPLAGTIKVYFA